MVSDLFAPASRVSRGGDQVDIYGQSRPGEGQLPTTLPPPSPGTGIYGIGDVAGVEGDCDGAGTGVVGESTGGKGVIGESVSAADIGVYGQSLAVSPSPLPASPDTGIFGTGDNIGVLGESARGRGVIGNSVSAAEIGVYGQSLAVSPGPCRPVRVQEYSGQVTTLALRGRVGAAGRCIYYWIANTSASRSGAIGSSRTAASQCRNPSAPPFDPPPQLPRLGRAGDVLAATVQIDEVNIARLWFCAQSGTATQPALWAEISFSRTIAGTSP